MEALDGHFGTPCKFRRRARMIDVRMRKQNLFECESFVFDDFLDLLEVAAWIDHRGALRVFGPEDRTVLREWRDGNNADLHGAEGMSLVIPPIKTIRRAC